MQILPIHLKFGDLVAEVEPHARHIIFSSRFQRNIMGLGCGGGSTCKAALKKFEESTGSRAAECPEIRLIGVAFASLSYRGITLGYNMQQGHYHIHKDIIGYQIQGYHIGISNALFKDIIIFYHIMP